MTETTPLDRAIKIVGSATELANQIGVKKQAVTKWRRRVPAERVLSIELATNGEVTRHELRPDLYPTA